MTRKRITQGSPFEAEFAYSRAVAEGDWVFVAGTTGYDYATMTISPDPAEQARQCFRNIAAALAEAGASLSDVVRVKYILPNGSDFAACAPAIREAFSEARPAATMFVAGLLDPAMKIEIEVTAKRQG